MTGSSEHLEALFDKLGVYDVHITVDETQLYTVQQFAHQHGIHLAFAVGKNGQHCRQLMTSQHITGTAIDVLAQANALAAKMHEEAGIRVLRVKLEAMAGNEHVQAAMREFQKTNEFANNKCYAYEFHYKVQIDTKEQQQAFEALCVENDVSFALNMLSSKAVKYPLVSQRVRGEYARALECRAAFRAKLQAAALTVLMDGTHNEAIVYDSNYSLDAGFVPDPVEV